MFNAHHEDVDFTLPEERWGHQWVRALDTSDEQLPEDDRTFNAGEQVPVKARSLMVLRRGE
jgi:isoamylase